jgi:hypothetical protein
VASETPFVCTLQPRTDGFSGCGLEFSFPWTRLPLDQFQPYLYFLDRSGVDGPQDAATSFLIAQLNSDGISNLQLVFEAG